MLAGFSPQSSVQLCHSLHCGPHYRIPLAFGSSTSLFRVAALGSQPYTQEGLGNTSLLGLRGSVIGPTAPKTVDTFHSPPHSVRARREAFPSAAHTNHTCMPTEISRLLRGSDQKSLEKVRKNEEAHRFSPLQASFWKQCFFAKLILK